MKYFEQILEELNEKSRKTAWLVAAVACGLCVVLVGVIFAMTPLKRTEVRLLVVDKNTGYPSEITTLADFQSGNVKKMLASEALNKYFVQQYIIAHDSYNHYTVRDAWKTVQMYSTPDVFKDYAKKFEPPHNIEERIGKGKVLEVIIHSMNLMPTKTDYNGKNIGRIMQARVEKRVRSGDNIEERSTGTVTISFAYDEHLRMDEQSRNTNPLGFTVTAYQYAFDQRTENFPEPQEFYPVTQQNEIATPTVSPESHSPKPETTSQDGVSPANVAISGNLNNASVSFKEPETVTADEKGVPPVVTDNSGNLNATQGQAENHTRHSEPLGEESQSKQQDSSPALQVQNDGKEQGNNTQGEKQ